jgi:hypothetical protein
MSVRPSVRPSVRRTTHTHTHSVLKINKRPASLSRSSPVSSQFQFSRYGGFDRRQLLKLWNSGCPSTAHFCICVLATPRRWRVGRPRDRGSFPVTGGKIIFYLFIYVTRNVADYIPRNDVVMVIWKWNGMSDRGLFEILFQGGRNYNRPSTDYRSQRYRLRQPSGPIVLC